MRINEVRTVPATPQRIAQARQFVQQKWRERAAERGDPKPVDLSDACKFVSMFAQRVFGGRLRGNWDHQYVVLKDGSTLDLTEPSQNLDDIRADGRDPYRHDGEFWNNHEHRESMASCTPRIRRWVNEFLTNLDRN